MGGAKLQIFLIRWVMVDLLESFDSFNDQTRGTFLQTNRLHNILKAYISFRKQKVRGSKLQIENSL